MPSNKQIRALAVAAGLLVAASAAAQRTSTVTLNNIQYRLIDLAPSDGIAPGVAFDLSNGDFGNYLRSEVSLNGVVRSNEWVGTSMLDPLTMLQQNSMLTLDQKYASDGSLGGTTIQSAVTVLGTGLRANNATGWTGFDWLEFKLTPYTRIEFTADTSVKLSAPVDIDHYIYWRGERFPTPDDAIGSYVLDVVMWTDSGAFMSDQADEYVDLPRVWDRTVYEYGYVGGQVDLSAAIGVGMSNDGATFNSGFLSAAVRSSAVAYATSPISEAPSWAMLLAGVTVLAASRARRPSGACAMP